MTSYNKLIYFPTIEYDINDFFPFSLIGIVVSEGISDEDICRVVNEIYQRIYQVPVRLIVKQHVDRQSDIFIRCVEKSNSRDAQREMANQGYKDGPERWWSLVYVTRKKSSLVQMQTSNIFLG